MLWLHLTSWQEFQPCHERKPTGKLSGRHQSKNKNELVFKSCSLSPTGTLNFWEPSNDCVNQLVFFFPVHFSSLSRNSFVWFLFRKKINGRRSIPLETFSNLKIYIQTFPGNHYKSERCPVSLSRLTINNHFQGMEKYLKTFFQVDIFSFLIIKKKTILKTL